MSKRRIFGNLLVLGTNQIGTWLISMVTLVLIGRYLGPTNLGILSLAGAVVAVGGLLANLGMDTLVTRTVARSPERTTELVAAVMVVRLALMVPILAGLYLYTVIANYSTDTRMATVFLAIGMLVLVVISPLVSAMQGHERMGFPAVMGLLANLLDLGIAVLVIVTHSGIVVFTALCIPIALVGAALNILWAGRFARVTLRATRRTIEEVVRGGFVFWANSIFLTIYIYIDSIMLGSLAGTGAVGIYAPALRFFSVGLFLPGIVGMATFPVLSRRGVDAGEDFMRAGRQTLTLLLVGAVPLTIGLATFGGELITIIYGPTYQASVPVLAVLSLSLVPTFLNVQAANTLIAQDRQWRWTVIMALSCVINPLTNLILIPFAQHHWQNGALGAAVALIGTETFMMGYAVLVLRRMLVHPTVVRAVLACLCAGLGQITLLWLCGRFWPPLAQAVGLAGYTVLVVALGALPRSDLALILNMIRGHRSGRSDSRDSPDPGMDQAPVPS